GFNPNIVVAGYKKELLLNHLEGNNAVEIAVQEEQKGTAHAVMQVTPLKDKLKENLIVLMGDVPLLSQKTIQQLVDVHTKNNAIITVLTAQTEEPSGYGRILKNSKGNVVGIVEEKDCTAEEREIKEINSGIYIFNTSYLFDNLSKINNVNKQNEFYLTDIVKIASDEGQVISSFCVDDVMEITGVNSINDLEQLQNHLNNQ
ncbi:MAG: bifunctional UDP-N-acetylglucosamine diphosphorylase/glucosamine-1-phosphate N-acetyltransferase GlmU, partial [Nitrospinae bacterium]|nr:bifunctional UDP-N-acetylglucosamine diphosphorylase/glucosamine-1-phosphate N-acetyltransferase GlmU [Nitrospinota bacterium]